MCMKKSLWKHVNRVNIRSDHVVVMGSVALNTIMDRRKLLNKKPVVLTYGPRDFLKGWMITRSPTQAFTSNLS